MNEVSANRFRRNLEDEVDRVVEGHEVLRVTRRRGGDFVVMSADDWSAIEENLVPGVVESIHRAAEEPLEEGTRIEDLDW